MDNETEKKLQEIGIETDPTKMQSMFGTNGDHMTNELPENDPQQAQVQMKQDIEIDHRTELSTKDAIKVLEQILSDAEEECTCVFVPISQPHTIVVTKTYKNFHNNKRPLEVRATLDLSKLLFAHHDIILKWIRDKWIEDLHNTYAFIAMLLP